MKRRTFLKGTLAAGGITLASKPALGADTPLEPGTWYDATITDGIDGDTVDIELDSDGTAYNIRILGIDTPEKTGNLRYENVAEWEGIEDADYLETWGNNASTFAQNELPVGTSVQIAVDPDSEEEDIYGRLLAKIRYDRTGSGSFDTVYNKLAVEEGYARVYSASMSNTDEYWAAEDSARANGRGVWQNSDPANTTEVRDNNVAETFHPNTSSVRTTGGALAETRVPLWAEADATQTLDSGAVDYGSDDIPLVGVDRTARTALVGGLSIQEDHDAYAKGYEHFVFLLNLIDDLAADGRSGMVLVEGGHDQFGGDFACCAEDTVYFQRYLEGQGIELAGVNRVETTTGAQLSNARALVVTSPASEFTTAEVNAITTFRDNGGAVLLLGSGEATDSRRTNLNTLASDLGSDLRLNADIVTDGTNNANNDAALVTTGNLNTTDFSLWTAYSGSTQAAELSIDRVHRNAATLNEEWVDVTNDGDASLDLDGYTLENGDGDTYTFPTNFSLAAGATVRVHTGSGSDSTSDLYWGASLFRWDTDADTATIRDTSGDVVTQVAWSVPDVTVPTVNPDGATLNDEYIDLRNETDDQVDLSGWTVSDAVGTTYTVPSGFTLDAGATVRLHTGSGTDSATDLYWGRGAAVWNNGGDTVEVRDAASALVQTREYPSPYNLSVTELNLSEEYVDVTNDGSSIVDMSGFSIEDEAGTDYQFPDSFALDAGATVRVHTGEGTNTTTDLYWGYGISVWNDDGDTAYVFDDNGVQIASGSPSSGSSGSDVTVAQVNEDGATLNDEWVDFENTTGSEIDLTGWTVEDAAAHTYQFPDGYSLTAGGTGRLHTGDGTDSSSDGDVYWGSGSAIWNNSGDTVYLYEADGTLHAEYTY